MFKIMVTEDDRNTSKLMKAIITRGGYEVVCAADGVEALELMDRQHIDLIVLDVMMPNMDGYEFTDTLRSCGDNTPILMVTAKELPEDKCRGFIAGTDDYMIKPVNEEELLLRIKALLRRAQIANERKLYIGDVVLDYDSLTVTKGGVSQSLPQKEFYAERIVFRSGVSAVHPRDAGRSGLLRPHARHAGAAAPAPAGRARGPGQAAFRHV